MERSDLNGCNLRQGRGGRGGWDAHEAHTN